MAPTIALAMIVRNEAPTIERCLASVRPLITHWLVVDTGSTDGTQERVRAALADLPGRLVERPWKDFAHNRSEALALARPMADYSLAIDADDALELPSGYALPPLDRDSYTVEIRDVTLTYRRTQLVRNQLPWEYRGVLHEFVACDGATTSGDLDLVMRRNHDGARRRDPLTYGKDAAILQAALAVETDPFLRSRYTFYLAQSHRDFGERTQAIDRYLDRAEMGFWSEEVYVSLLQAGRLMLAENRPLEEALAVWRRAAEVSPARNEARHAASLALRQHRRFEEGYQVAAPGTALPAPQGALFLEQWIHEYGLRDEYAVNAYWSGHHADCLSTCLALLGGATLPGEMRERVAANAGFAARLLHGPAPEPLPRAPAAPWVPSTPLGGTELMEHGLRERLGIALDTIDLRTNLLGDMPPGERPLVIWVQHAPDQAAVAWMADPVPVARVQRFVFVSDWQRQRFLESFATLVPERCVVLHNATAVPPAPRSQARGRPVRIAYTSTPFRGLSVLLDAWERLQPLDAELHIWSSHRLYGPGFSDEPYRALWDKADRLPGVVRHGIVPNPELREALRSIDILAYPSTFEETSCVSVIEAMSAGCRVVCPALGALAETTAGFARLYPPGGETTEHARQFASVLAAELREPWGFRPDLMREQREFCLRHYDWPVRVAEWRAFIDDVAGPPAAPAAPDTRNRVVDALARLRDRGFDPAGILDVGAHDGAFARLAREVFPRAFVLMVDALAEKGEVLARTAQEIGQAGHVIALLGETNAAERAFHVVDVVRRPELVTTGASAFREATGLPMTERRVQQRTLGPIAGARPSGFQLLKLDVQGAELSVLHGMGEQLAGVEVLLLEMSLVQYNEGAPLFAEVLAWLTAQGFVLDDIVEQHRSGEALLQVDGLFVRASSHLRAQPPVWG